MLCQTMAWTGGYHGTSGGKGNSQGSEAFVKAADRGLDIACGKDIHERP